MTSSGAHCHHLADSLCEPQSRAREDLSYKLIDTESPPYFVNTSRSLVYTTLGRTVILECRVRNLGNRAVSLVTDTPLSWHWNFQVSWIRQSDLHILTVGETSYTNSLKFMPTPPRGSDEWNLRSVSAASPAGWVRDCRITNPGLSDSGVYECQINTEPKRSRLYHLDVVISQARLTQKVCCSYTGLALTCLASNWDRAVRLIIRL